MRSALALCLAGVAFAPATVCAAPTAVGTRSAGSGTPPANVDRDAPLARSFDLIVDRDALAALETRNTAARADGAAVDDRVPIAISSEAAVRRYDWYEDRYFDEVLDHSPASVDLTRAARGLPFLLSHDSRDQYGIVEDVTLGKDRKLRGMVRFSRAQRAQEIRQDMLDGIRNAISVGYALGDDYEQTERADGSLERRFKQWAPYEASSVPIPADTTVGVGRAHASTSNSGRKAGAQNMETVQTPAANGGTGGSVAVADRSAPEFTRAQIVDSMCEAAGLTLKDAREFRDSDKSVDEIGRLVFAKMTERAEQNARRTPSVELSAREANRYSLIRAASAASSDNWRAAGLEQEVSKTIAAALGKTESRHGFFMPTNLPLAGGVRTLLTVGTAAKGGNLVATELEGTLIDLLRNQSIVLGRLGARLVDGLVGNVAFPRQTAAMTGVWVGEAPSAPGVALSSPSFDQVTLTAKTISAATTISRQLMAQSNVNGGAEQIVREDIVAQLAIALDAAAIGGNTGGNNPVGAVYTTGAGALAIGANGGTFTLALVQAGLKALEIANGLTDSTTFLANINSKYSLLATQRIAGTSDRTLWDASSNTVEGVPAFATNNVPTGAAFNKGTTVDGSLGVSMFADWTQCMVGEWGNGLEIIVDPMSLARQGLVQITALQFADVQFRQPSKIVRWVDTK